MYPSVILFSGGLDSTAAAVAIPNATLLRIDTETTYDAIESYRANKTARALGRELVELRGVFNFSRMEQADALVPGRNAFLTLLAAQHSSRVALISVAGDGTHATDKDPTFALYMSRLASHLYGRPVTVTLPFREISKNDLVDLALATDRERFRAALASVWSCYTPAHGLHCGTCKACARLWASLHRAELPEPLWAQHPMDMPRSTFLSFFEGRGSEEADMLELTSHV